MFAEWKDEKTVEKYLTKKGFLSVCIYGFGNNGKKIYSQIHNTSIRITGIIDKKAQDPIDNIPYIVFTDDTNTFPLCDAIIVTVVEHYYGIAQRLMEVTNIPVISLYEIMCSD